MTVVSVRHSTTTKVTVPVACLGGVSDLAVLFMLEFAGDRRSDLSQFFAQLLCRSKPLAGLSCRRYAAHMSEAQTKAVGRVFPDLRCSGGFLLRCENARRGEVTSLIPMPH